MLTQKKVRGATRGGATEHAYITLRSEILNGNFAEGERLTEAMLAETLGLSRTPVRDALGRLIVEGLVARGPGYGVRVVSFSEDEIGQVFAIRELLETYAVKRAALEADEDDIAALRALADEMKSYIPPQSESDLTRLSAANQEFHKRIILAAGSPRLATLLNMTIDMALVFRTYRLYSQRDLLRSSRHHEEIVDAIEGREPQWAASVMRSHLLAAAATARRRR
ncbi:MAG: GntR family transcriptional regulator [Devosia sp.]